MARNPAATAEGVEVPKRRRRSGPRGPRIATVLAHVEDGKPVIDVLTFSSQGMELLDKFAELKNRGVEPSIIRYTMPATTKPEGDESGED